MQEKLQAPPLFSTGQLVATPGALALLRESNVSALTLLVRHVSGDWGNVPDDDAESNRLAVQEGHRLLSSYDVSGKRLWVITEWDRSVTTLLLPSEY
jgi:hypothetical protein